MTDGGSIVKIIPIKANEMERNAVINTSHNSVEITFPVHPAMERIDRIMTLSLSRDQLLTALGVSE